MSSASIAAVPLRGGKAGTIVFQSMLVPAGHHMCVPSTEVVIKSGELVRLRDHYIRIVELYKQSVDQYCGTLPIYSETLQKGIAQKKPWPPDRVF